MRPAALVVALALVAAACATNPVTGRRLARVSERPNLPWHFTIVAEAQADGLGVHYALRAGWDPAGIPQMLTTLGRVEEASDNKGVPNTLSTHPAPKDRVQRVQAAVRQAEAGAERFAIELPTGWDVNNGQARVVAKESGLNPLVVLEAVRRPVGRAIQDVALRSKSIAERQGHGVVKASTLAIMNEHIVSDQPRPSERLKIVVAG